MRYKKARIVIGIFVFFISGVYAETPGSLDRFILDAMQNHSIQGLSALILKDGKIAWSKGYGYADIEKNIPFTPNTINAEIASLSKTITATAIMQLWEKKMFRLDDPINDYLPFTVKNPYFPDVPITFKMLLTHTSSLYTDYDLGSDKFDFNSSYFPKLGKYLYNILNDKGDYYIDSVCFHKYKPGLKWNYCGTGYALTGYLVEVISKMPFESYCDQNIFTPLGMNHTSWHFSGVDTNTVSRPYGWSDEANGYADYGLYEYPTYPEGQLKTNIVDLSKFLWMNMNDGEFDGNRILNKSTIKLMHSDIVTISDTSYIRAAYGIGWGHIKVNHKNLWGHHGRDIGVSTEMMYDIDMKTGVILLTNGEDDASALIPCMNFDDIVCKLFEVADTITTINLSVLTVSYVSNSCEHGVNFWKNNSALWALNALPMKLGMQYFYDREQVLSLLEINDTTNATAILTKQLIAAKLNVANGSELSPIVRTINAANALIGNSKLPICPVITTDSNDRIRMIYLAKTLESYNHALSNKEKCSGLTKYNTEIE